MNADIRTNTYDDGTTDVRTGEQKIRNFNINFGPQHPLAVSRPPRLRGADEPRARMVHGD